MQLPLTDPDTLFEELLQEGTIQISGQQGNERRARCEDTTELTTKPESSMMLQRI
jgi:hypothetical protein